MATRMSSPGHTFSPLNLTASGLLVAAVGGAALLFAPLVPGVNEVVAALLVGLLLANLGGDRVVLAPAVGAFMLKRTLKLAVILLGAGVQVALIRQVGVPALLVIVVAIVAALVATALLSRWQGLQARPAALVGIGTAICGASAIAALAPVVRAKQEEVGVALATVLGCNAVALLLYPVIGAAAGWDAAFYGTWAGVAVHDTASAVATGFALGHEAGEVATVVKLARILFLLPLLLIVAAAMTARQNDGVGDGLGRRLWQSIPWFVVGFVAMVVANSLGWLGAVGPVLSDTAKILIVFVVAAIGLTLRLRELASLGRRTVVVGAGASVTMAAVSLGVISALGIGG